MTDPTSRRLVVLADSLTLTASAAPDDDGGRRLYPHVAAAIIGSARGEAWTARSFGAPGLTVPAMLRWVRSSPRLRSRIASSDAILIAVGSLDASTAGFPLAFNDTLRTLLPAPLKRFLLVLFNRLNPLLIKVRRERSPQTSRKEYRRSWAALADLCAELAPGVPIIATLPAIHNAPHGGRSIRHHADTVSDTVELAGARGIPIFDVPGIQRPNLHLLAPDGMHWTYGMHDVVGQELAQLLEQVLAADDRRPSP